MLIDVVPSVLEKVLENLTPHMRVVMGTSDYDSLRQQLFQEFEAQDKANGHIFLNRERKINPVTRLEYLEPLRLSQGEMELDLDSLLNLELNKEVAPPSAPSTPPPSSTAELVQLLSRVSNVSDVEGTNNFDDSEDSFEGDFDNFDDSEDTFEGDFDNFDDSEDSFEGDFDNFDDSEDSFEGDFDNFDDSEDSFEEPSFSTPQVTEELSVTSSPIEVPPPSPTTPLPTPPRRVRVVPHQQIEPKPPVTVSAYDVPSTIEEFLRMHPNSSIEDCIRYGFAKNMIQRKINEGSIILSHGRLTI